MSLPILVDMNLSPEWIPFLNQAGWPAVHWSTVGDPRADDRTIMAWARGQKHAVLTHDLDFGTTLALTHASGPSVVQVRTENVLPEHIGQIVLTALQQYESELTAGALLVIEPTRNRVRVLPF
jgi:predicted nuclease of predicted toxin-antitoxin system